MLVLYRCIISIYFCAIRLAAWFLPDAKAFVAGRANWRDVLTDFNQKHAASQRPRLWVHASSLGEFEQGRECIEMIRREYPDLLIILSFFSPSGYHKQKDYKHADLVCYFPSDLSQDVRTFLDLLNPNAALFIKYDYWFNTLLQLTARKIPYFFIAVHFRKNHYLLRPVMKRFLDIIMDAGHIFLQDEKSSEYLRQRGYTNHSVVGDTRLDRVFRIAQEPYENVQIREFCGQDPILVAGSVWPADLTFLKAGFKNLIERGWKIIWVPHKIHQSELLYCESVFKEQTVRLSKFQMQATTRVLIVDEVGQLARIYRYATLAYVGGGFGKGIHNLLEPASYGIPVCFGPNYQKFPEATELIHRGVAFPIAYKLELVGVTTQIQGRFPLLKEKILTYFAEYLGASQKIFTSLKTQIDRWHHR